MAIGSLPLFLTPSVKMLQVVVNGSGTHSFTSSVVSFVDVGASRPNKPNPLYKGKWYAPMIDNPAYIGEWAPRKISNPDFFEDLDPIKSLEKIVRILPTFLEFGC